MAFYVQSCGEIVILAIIVGLMYAVDVRASEANNNWGLSVLIAFATGVWLLLAVPWFVLEKRRPGQPVPPNMNMYDHMVLRMKFWLTCRQCHGWDMAIVPGHIADMGRYFRSSDLSILAQEMLLKTWLPETGNADSEDYYSDSSKA